MDMLSGNEHTTFVCTHTPLNPGSSPVCSPPRCPAAELVSPDAPALRLALLFLLTSLPWQCQARAPSAPDHFQAEPESFAGAQQHLSSQGRGTRLSPCAAVRSLHGSSRQSRVLLAGWGLTGPVVGSPGDSATGGQGTTRDGHGAA